MCDARRSSYIRIPTLRLRIRIRIGNKYTSTSVGQVQGKPAIGYRIRVIYAPFPSYHPVIASRTGRPIYTYFYEPSVCTSNGVSVLIIGVVCSSERTNSPPIFIRVTHQLTPGLCCTYVRVRLVLLVVSLPSSLVRRQSNAVECVGDMKANEEGKLAKPRYVRFKIWRGSQSDDINTCICGCTQHTARVQNTENSDTRPPRPRPTHFCSAIVDTAYETIADSFEYKY